MQLSAMDAGDDLVVQIEMLPLGDLGDGEAAEIVEGGEAFLIHPIRQAIDHVFDDAEAVVHGGGADLHVAAARAG